MSFRLPVFAFAAFLMSPTLVWSQDMPKVNGSGAFASVLEAYEAGLASECAAFENGTLDASQDGVRMVADFNGDGITDPILDTSVYACSTMASFYSGTGGRLIVVFVSSEQASDGYERFEFLGEGNITTSFGDSPIFLLAQHGANCDRAGFEPCFGAYSWSQDHFASAGGQVRASE